MPASHSWPKHTIGIVFSWTCLFKAQLQPSLFLTPAQQPQSQIMRDRHNQRLLRIQLFALEGEQCACHLAENHRPASAGSSWRYFFVITFLFQSQLRQNMMDVFTKSLRDFKNLVCGFGGRNVCFHNVKSITLATPFWEMAWCQPVRKSVLFRMCNNPHDVSSLRLFLGMVKFFGRFISRCSSLLHPLNRLLKKDIKFGLMLWDCFL